MSVQILSTEIYSCSKEESLTKFTSIWWHARIEQVTAEQVLLPDRGGCGGARVRRQEWEGGGGDDDGNECRSEMVIFVFGDDFFAYEIK